MKKIVSIVRSNSIYALGLSAVLTLSSILFPAVLHLPGNVLLTALVCGALLAVFLKTAAIVTLFGLDFFKEGSYSLATITRGQMAGVFVGTMVLATAQLAILAQLLPGLITVGNVPAAVGIIIAGWFVGVVAQGIYKKVRNIETTGVCPIRQGKRKPAAK